MTKTTKKTGGATVDLLIMPDIAWFRAQVCMMMMIGMNHHSKVITTYYNVPTGRYIVDLEYSGELCVCNEALLIGKDLVRRCGNHYM